MGLAVSFRGWLAWFWRRFLHDLAPTTWKVRLLPTGPPFWPTGLLLRPTGLLFWPTGLLSAHRRLWTPSSLGDCNCSAQIQHFKIDENENCTGCHRRVGKNHRPSSHVQLKPKMVYRVDKEVRNRASYTKGLEMESFKKNMSWNDPLGFILSASITQAASRHVADFICTSTPTSTKAE